MAPIHPHCCLLAHLALLTPGVVDALFPQWFLGRVCAWPSGQGEHPEI